MTGKRPSFVPLLLLLLLFASQGAFVEGAELKEEQLQFMKDLYFSTGGPSWRVRPTNANDGKSWCNFPPYVVCNGAGDITTLRLEGFNLRGPIPSSIGALKEVNNLHLFSNQLTGPIPEEVGQLTKLYSFKLFNNKLSGPIPPGIFLNGTLLNIVDFSNNELTGNLPEFPSTVKEIYLYDNKFTGSIPESYTQIQFVRYIGLQNNRLTGTLPAFTQNATFFDLNVSNNTLIGTIPLSLANCVELRRLGLANNKLTGAIPSELGSLQKLESLVLNDNQFTGSIPGTLSDILTLEKV